MANYTKCEQCKEYHWNNLSCNPMFKVYEPETMGDSAKTVRASDHEDAAIEFAKWYNEDGDYELMNNTIDVEVEDESGKRIKFTVGAEPDIHYSAKQIESLN